MYGLYNQPQIIGNLAQAKNYNEIQSVPVAVNGAPTLFMMENESVMYLVSAQNGQKVIQGYKFEPLPTQQETTENRLNNLETMMINIQKILEGKMNNESSTANADGKQSATTGQPNVAAGK